MLETIDLRFWRSIMSALRFRSSISTFHRRRPLVVDRKAMDRARAVPPNLLDSGRFSLIWQAEDIVQGEKPVRELVARRPAGPPLRWWVGSIVLAAGLAGCTANGSPTSTSNANPTTTIKRHVLVATYADNGGTLTVLVNDRLRVVLAGTSWTQQSSDSSIVAQIGKASVLPASSGCVQGQGCGSVTVYFHALKKGRAQILGDRSSCSGAGSTCTTGPRAFRLNVVVLQ